MKNYILPLVTFLFLMSCEEENPQPLASDPFVGTWHLENSEMGLNVSFDINKDMNFSNIEIEYPGITESLSCDVETFHRYPVNAGYEEIKIFCGGDQQWIVLIMHHNRIHLDAPDELLVYNLRVEMINHEPIDVEDQVFTRIE